MSSVDSKVRMLSHLIILWSTRERSKIETRVAGGGGGGDDDTQPLFTKVGSPLSAPPFFFFKKRLNNNFHLSCGNGKLDS